MRKFDKIINEKREDKSNWRKRLSLVNERNSRGGQNEDASGRFDFTPRMDGTRRFDELRLRIHAMKFSFARMRTFFHCFSYTEVKPPSAITYRVPPKVVIIFLLSIINARLDTIIKEYLL